jgi:hypothetical protein
MGEAAGRDPEAARIEKALSDDLAKLAEAEEDSSEKVVEVFSGVGAKIIDAVKNGLSGVHQGVKDVRDELKDAAEGADEKMDEVVGLIVDPIRKGLSAVTKELTSGLDPVLGAGIVVGAIYALRGEISKGLKWLWDNWEVVVKEAGELIRIGLKEGWALLKTVAPYILEGLVKLGDVIIGVLKEGWNILKDTVVPGIVEGVKALGQIIWDISPDWLQKGFKAVGLITTTITSLAADVGSFILGGLEKLLKAVGLDTLASAVGYLVDVLDALVDWLPGGRKRAAKEKKTLLGKGAAGGTTPAGIMESGNEQAVSMFTEAKELGLGEWRAAGLAGVAFEDERRASLMMQTFRAAVAAGKSAPEALKDASVLGAREEAGGRVGATARPLGSEIAGEGVGEMASDRAASIVAARESNETLKKVLMLQEQALNEQRLSSARTAPEVLDTISSADPLGVFSTGRMAGGMT